jgi:hypothetical protein
MNDLELLQVSHIDKKIRCGTNRDGGYVIAELDVPIYAPASIKFVFGLLYFLKIS